MRASPRRQRPIRVLLALVFIVPLASLLALWGFAASVTVSNAIQEHSFQSEDNQYGGWAQTLFTALAQEREQAFSYLSSGQHLPVAPYLAQQRATNKAVAAFETGLDANRSEMVSSALPALSSFKSELSWLSGAPGYVGIRPEVEAGTISPLAAFQDYNAIIDSEFQLYASLVAVNNTSLYMQAAASVDAGRAVELASREATLVTGAMYADGQMTKSERILFAQTAATRQFLMSEALKELQPSLGSGYQRAQASAAYKSFTALEDQVIRSIGTKGPLTISGLQLAAATVPLFSAYQKAEAQDRIALSSMGTKVGDRLLLEVALAGGLGLLAVVVSVFLVLWFGRRVSRDLTNLQRAALDLAEERLPQVVARLGSGEDVDVAAEAAPLTAGRIAETAKVAEAFSTVQRTALEAAVGQARLRHGISQVFRNLAWRSQSLLHRQLALLDAMERRQSEPETLDELFQLDHLTTRMRRHAEGLLILSDSSPGRGWRDPVPVVDVLRGAIAEVEDYKRVNVYCNSDDAVVGTAVADVIHLLAELIENATAYSPSTTEVTLRAERVANGFVVEVEDRGIGISEEETAAINERLASPPEFDLADSNRLGLFVVARLAAKHHIKITLRRSPYGGTTAIVLLPHAVVVAGEPASAERFGVLRTETARTELVRAETERTETTRTELPAGPMRPGADGHIEHAASVALGRLTPPVGSDDDPWASPSLWDTGAEMGPAAVRAAAIRAAAVGADNNAAVLGSGRFGSAAGRNGADATASGAASDDDSSTADGDGIGWTHDGGPGGQADDEAGRGQVDDSRSLTPNGSTRMGNGDGSPALGDPGIARDDIWLVRTGDGVPAGNGDPGSAAPDGNGGSAAGVTATRPDGDGQLPWLPRRERQASLAPQLKAGEPSVRHGTEPSASEGPSPAGTRALVESLQFGLNRARLAPDPAEETWPTAAGPELTGSSGAAGPGDSSSIDSESASSASAPINSEPADAPADQEDE